jgi:hypothetical protein
MILDNKVTVFAFQHAVSTQLTNRLRHNFAVYTDPFGQICMMRRAGNYP